MIHFKKPHFFLAILGFMLSFHAQGMMQMPRLEDPLNKASGVQRSAIPGANTDHLVPHVSSVAPDERQIYVEVEKQTGAPAKIILIRHGEKVRVSHEVIQTIPKEEFSSFKRTLPLSMPGQMRAQALAILFSQDRFSQRYVPDLQRKTIAQFQEKHDVKSEDMYKLNPSFPTPHVIFAARPSPDTAVMPSDEYVRTVQTVEPLAKSLGLDIVQKYHVFRVLAKGPDHPQDELAFYQPMAQDLLNNYPGQVILVCWEHKTISLIAKNLGVSDEVFNILREWPSKTFDQVWEINFGSDGKISYVDNYPQNIMQGDSNQAPKRYEG